MSADAPTTIPTLEVRRRVPAPPQVVFDTRTDPEQVRQWLGGQAMSVPDAAIDRWRISQHQLLLSRLSAEP